MAFKEIDIRIIKPSKWQIPKSEDILSYDTSKPEDIVSYNTEGKYTFLSIGYFDMIEVQKVNGSELDHPLLRAYHSSHRHQNERTESGSSLENLMKTYTTQELILFTNIGENGFSKEQIDDFWKTDSLLTFVSLIHVDNDMAKSSASEFGGLIDRIKKNLAGKDYVYYFSFDYSGIVILAKNMSAKDYLNVLFQLNFENTSTSTKKWIRDSFSLYALDRRKLVDCFGLLKKEESIKNSIPKYCGNDHFSAAINIGVQNYTHYKNFYEELKGIGGESKSKITEYGLLGRYDISIVNDDADLEWLIRVQYLLNKYTVKDKDNPEDTLLSSYETFIKISTPPTYDDIDVHENNEAYTYALEELDKLCHELEENLSNKRDQYCGEYISPIRAVKYSILSILKNRFAEDFVLCMYQSFTDFLRYLIKKTKQKIDDVSAFDKTFNEYFRGLNSLVNSAMHSERQFVQATAFNAIIYDVPSKIMAFYVATIQELQNLVKSEMDKHYTFLLTPSFREQIFVRVISYEKEEMPHDRMLMVSISERSLYNPSQVIHCMAHEVAHFVGDKLRNRKLRKKCVISSIVHLVLCDLFPHFLYASDEFDSLKEHICEAFTSWDFSVDQENYSNDLDNLSSTIPAEFYKNADVRAIIKKYISDEIAGYSVSGEKTELIDYVSYIALQETGLETNVFVNIVGKRESYTPYEIDILVNLIWEDIYRRISEIYLNVCRDIFMGELLPNSTSQLGSGILQQVPLSGYVNALKSAYSEAFADVQMILLLGITYEKYLESFVIEEELDIEMFKTCTEDILRIVAVVMIMKYTGFWNIPSQDELFSDFYLSSSSNTEGDGVNEGILFKLLDFHATIQSRIEMFENTIRFKKMKSFDEVCEKVLNYKTVMEEDENAIISEGVGEQAKPLWEDDFLSSLFKDLLDYLRECVSESVQHYAQKSVDIGELRKTIGLVIECKDIEQVFCNVCQEIDTYKNSLFHK